MSTKKTTPKRQASLRSQLSLTMLLVGLVPALAIAVLAVVFLQTSLRTAAEARVVTAGDGRAEAIETLVSNVSGQISTFAQDRTTIDGLARLPAAFEAMGSDAGVDETSFGQLEDAVAEYYRGPFSASLEKAAGPDAEVPGAEIGGLDRASIVAQYAYIAGNRHPTGSKDDLMDSGNATTYDAIHASIHPGIRSLVDEFGYYDIFLIEAETGRIVYSVYKEVDYGTSLVHGPWAGTNLAAAYREALTLGSSERSVLVGYEKYGPSYGAPASFIASPVYDGRTLLGVAAFQLPIDRVSAAVGSVQGLGETGDAVLVGPDKLLRSDSLRNESLNAAASFRDNVMVESEAVEHALDGEKGIIEAPSLLGEDALIAYRLIDFGGTKLALLTSQDLDEAMSAAHTALYWSIGLLLPLAGAIALLSVRLTRGMAGDVTAMVETIVAQSSAVASGKLLSRNEPTSTRYHEFTSVLTSINQVADAFTAQMDAVPVPIIVHDKELKTSFVNAEAARLAHKDAEDLIGHIYYEHSEPRGWRDASFSTRRTLQSGTKSEDVSEWRTSGGSRDIRSVQTPIVVEGAVVGALETLLDETEIRTSERAQKKVSAYNLEAAERLKVAFQRVIAGDLSSRFVPPESTETEVSETAERFTMISTVFEAAMKEFSSTIDTTRENANRTAEAAIELGQVAATLLNGNETTAERASTVAAATEEMSANVDSVASAAEEMSINIGSVSQNATAMSSRMRAVSAAIETLSGSIGDVAEAAANGSTVASDASTKSALANKAMATLSRAAEEIDKVTEVIKRIAEKTNLLALNATIEAASAGEAGKGFAVVAHEVKELANQCSTAAEDITERIAGVQRNTGEAVQVIGAMSEIIANLAQVSDGISMRATEQDRAVNEISATVATVDADVEQTASAIAEIVQGANDVSRNVGELTAGSTEIASSIGEVNVLAQSGGEAARRVESAASSLSRVVEELRQGIEKFATSNSKPHSLRAA